MPSKMARRNMSLEEETLKIMQIFQNAGFDPISPSIIQSADIFLDVIGEALRARTYVFTDPEGEELCLRPDLTVPACRYYLEEYKAEQTEIVTKRYSYHGPAFRYQPVGTGDAHPREFHQAGIETFGDEERESADAKTAAVILKALESLGLKKSKLIISDIDIFRELLKAIHVPERWSQSLTRFLGRPQSFYAELKRLTQYNIACSKKIPQGLLKRLDPQNLLLSEEVVLDYLSANGIEPNGVRTVAEITKNLIWHLQDAQVFALTAEKADLIDQYLKIRGPLQRVGQNLKDLLERSEINFTSLLETHQKRIQYLSDSGVDISTVEFSAEFGRQLAYYTGFIFEIISTEVGAEIPVAGGGRYDDLMKAVGAKKTIPAVGGAIHTEKLLSVIEKGMS